MSTDPRISEDYITGVDEGTYVAVTGEPAVPDDPFLWVIANDEDGQNAHVQLALAQATELANSLLDHVAAKMGVESELTRLRGMEARMRLLLAEYGASGLLSASRVEEAMR